ncbi:MAG: PilZ domain-containing protein [Candidatus Omnitrophota bacterium]
MADKRGFIRHSIKAKVSFKFKGDLLRTVEGQTLDISSAGFGTFLEESIEVNTVVQFDLSADFLEQHLIGNGRIANVTQSKTVVGNSFRIGVEFIEVDKEIVLAFINKSQRIINEEQARIEAERKKHFESTDYGPF